MLIECDLGVFGVAQYTVSPNSQECSDALEEIAKDEIAARLATSTWKRRSASTNSPSVSTLALMVSTHYCNFAMLSSVALLAANLTP